MEFNNCTGLSKRQDVIKYLKDILFIVFSLSFTSLPVPSHSLTGDKGSCKVDGTANNVNEHASTDCSTRTRARTR